MSETRGWGVVFALTAIVVCPGEPRGIAQEKPDFLAAVRAGDMQRVTELLGSGVDVNKRDVDGVTALMLAANKPEMLRSLLDHGADVDVRTESEGLTALMVAATLGNPESVALLLKAGAVVDARSVSGLTALDLAAGAGAYRQELADINVLAPEHVQVVLMLLNAGASPGNVGDDGTTALWGAVESGSKDIVNALLDHGADPLTRCPDGSPVLWRGVAKGRYDIVTSLLKAGADANATHDQDSVLMVAAVQGYVAIVKLLLESGADPNFVGKFGRTALEMARDKGHQRIVEMLLEGRARR